MDKILFQGTEDIYAQALQKITAVVKDGTTKMVNFRGEDLQLFVEAIFDFYCKFLAYGLRKMGTSNSGRYTQLALITVNENVIHGEELFEILTKQKHTGKDEIKKFTQSKGPIVPEVIELLKLLLGKMSHAEAILTEMPSQNMLRQMVETVIEFMEQHEVYEPLVFFSENFSIMLGWLAGYFARYTEISSELLLMRGINVLQSVCIHPTMSRVVSTQKVTSLLHLPVAIPSTHLGTHLAGVL